MNNSKKAVIYYDAKCEFCKKVIYLISCLDFFSEFKPHDLWKYSQSTSQIKLNLKKMKQEIHLIDKNGNIYTGYEAFKLVFKKIPLLLPIRILLFIPGSDYFGKKFYNFIAINRYKIIPCKGNCQLTN